jgi:hypothetical protein
MTDLRARRHKSVRKRSKPSRRNVEACEDEDDRDEALIGAADDKPPAAMQGKNGAGDD